jgi:hypothetical protein
MQFDEPRHHVLVGGVDDGVGTDLQRLRQAARDQVRDDDVADAKGFEASTAPSPIGPAPNTTTLSVGLGRQRLAPWRATAIGSLSAATSQGM